MSGPRYTPLVASLPATVPFVGPETQERSRGRRFKARLGANESLFGPSPKAVAAMAEAAAEVWMYGDPENHDLRAALARHHGCAPSNIVVGEGIDGLLGYLVRMLVAPGDAVVTSDGAYPTFNFHVAGFGGALHKAPYRGDHEDPEALLAKVRDTGARLVYLANPDNPMGSHHPAATIRAMIEALPEGVLLILDEAYVDLAPEGTAPEIEADDPRVIRMRTFSKGYGMAGLRVGYAIAAPGLVAGFDKVRNHFGVGRIAQAGALAALQDQPW
ncbi:MAG: aminotransferase class I/II-fold pyridoxal phosphate-dependent enzyme, partial [Cereibacter changlensis]